MFGCEWTTEACQTSNQQHQDTQQNSNNDDDQLQTASDHSLIQQTPNTTTAVTLLTESSLTDTTSLALQNTKWRQSAGGNTRPSSIKQSLYNRVSHTIKQYNVTGKQADCM